MPHIAERDTVARRISSRAKPLLPVLLLCLGAFGALALARGRNEPTPAADAPAPPLVRAHTIPERSVALVVRARGVVTPRTETDLTPEVSGRVVRISTAFYAGGFFEAGDVLVEIDDRDYRSARKRAQAVLERAISEARLAASNLARLQALAKSEVVSSAALHEAESRTEVGHATVAEAQVTVEEAARNLERTRVRAPYAGRVREKNVDIGQVVAPGTPVARIYAVDYAEVRLPIRDADLAFLELPLDVRSPSDAGLQPAVVLSADFAGAKRRWGARVVRIEGHLDPGTRMVHLVARIDDPFGRRANGSGRVPLAMGMFVDAEIEGRVVDAAQLIPRGAVREGNRILVVDTDGRLRARTLQVIRTDADTVVAASLITPGELLCVSDRSTLVDGMRVRTRLEATSPTLLAIGQARSGPDRGGRTRGAGAQGVP